MSLNLKTVSGFSDGETHTHTHTHVISLYFTHKSSGLKRERETGMKARQAYRNAKKWPFFSPLYSLVHLLARGGRGEEKMCRSQRRDFINAQYLTALRVWVSFTLTGITAPSVRPPFTRTVIRKRERETCSSVTFSGQKHWNNTFILKSSLIFIKSRREKRTTMIQSEMLVNDPSKVWGQCDFF